MKDPENFSDLVSEALKEAQKVVVHYLLEGKWVFGICFGGQLAMATVGATLGRLPENRFGKAVSETGFLSHVLTPEGATDKVFGYLAEKEVVWAPHLHSDYVDELPMKGHIVETDKGVLTVERAVPLLVRNGYLGVDGPENTKHRYIHAAVVEFFNGARLYFIQPHPEMATSGSVSYLTRVNEGWLREPEQMGDDYVEKALVLPASPDLSIAQVLPNFAREARAYEEMRLGKHFADSVVARVILNHLIR